MGVKAELSDFLNHLPAVDGPDERKALLTFTGPSELGIYLNWQGSNVEFTERLLEELSRRGKGTVSGFLAALPNAPQVKNSVDLQQQLAALCDQVDALDEAAFQAEFPVPLPAGVPGERPPADPAMLAAAVVNEVLVPYYKLGGDQLRQKAGGRAATLAEGMAEKVEQALAGDVAAGVVFSIFKDDPEAGQAGMLQVLKAKLEGDATLASDLADVFTSAAAEPEGGGLQALVDVSQDIGVVRGDVVGAVVGADVLEKIQGVNVKEVIGTVAEGATVVGAVVGGSGQTNIGGQHHHGDVVNQSGGVHIGGDAQVGGDLVGRDKVVEGDSVGGDKITVGDISGSTGVAVGRDAQATVTQGISGEELAQLFGSIYEKIEARPEDPDVDKDELVDKVKRIEKEAGKGEEANANKVERWLRFLGSMAPDILKVTAAALANPLAGVGTAIGLIAEKARAEAEA
jgi:hypothetical protein